MKQRKRMLVAVLAASALFAAACSDDDDDGGSSATEPADDTTAPGDTTAPDDTTAPEDTATVDTEPAAEAWAVDTSLCVDPDAASAPIEGEIFIGSAMPLSGGAAAAAFAPVKSGFEAYIKYANENDLLNGVTIRAQIEDDQYNAELTPGAVDTLIAADADIFAGIIGSPNNAAVRQTLNDNCIPQLAALTGSPAWGQVADFPWTTGQLAPYDLESKVYAAQIATDFPDGASIALFHVNNEFGQVYMDAFTDLAGEFGLDIVGEETIEATDQAPPTSQITNIAALAPDVIMAVPLGAQCITFLTELANAKAANAGWEPQVYITNTCASSLILGAAGAAANGIFTSGNGIDIVNPENHEIPEVKTFRDYMAQEGLTDVEATAAAGWATAEVVVEILRQAQASELGLTRESIINAARNFDYHPSLYLPSINFTMSGEEDPYGAQSLVVRTYDATSKTFTDVGEIITEFES